MLRAGAEERPLESMSERWEVGSSWRDKDSGSSRECKDIREKVRKQREGAQERSRENGREELVHTPNREPERVEREMLSQKERERPRESKEDLCG